MDAAPDNRPATTPLSVFFLLMSPELPFRDGEDEDDEGDAAEGDDARARELVAT